MKEKKSLRRRVGELLELNALFWNVVIKYKVLYFYARLTNRSARKTILFYPDKPQPFHVLYKICHILGYKITNDLNVKADLVVHFGDATVRAADLALVALSKTQKVLNLDCNDISKEHVDKIFKEVFGYGTIIDPRTYSGKCVKKSNGNAKHDGVIIDCPAQPEEGYVYQRIINNQYDDMVLDDRAPVINNKIVFVYKKYRGIDTRFSNINASAQLVETKDAFSAEESAKILSFSKKMGLDYGELDILRDRDDGRIYIVDVNNTPAGPPNHIPKEEYQVALLTLAKNFQ